MQNYLDQTVNVAGQVGNAFARAFQGMEDQLVSLATTGTASFKSLIDSVISDVVRLQIRQNVTGPLAAGLNGILGSGGVGLSSLIGSASGGLSGSNAASVANVIGGDDRLGSMIGLMGLTKNALGGVYQSPSLSAYSNQVYDKPQLFAFAKGGVFAEEGPEAIMPLRRGADGRLGVSAGSGSGVVQVNIVNNGAPATAQVKQTRTSDGGITLDIIVDAVDDMLGDRIGAGSGSTARAIEGRYGLRTAVS